MNDKNTNSINGSATSGMPRFRYIYRGICTAILTFFALGLFLLVWLRYVSENNHTGYLLGLGNIAMASFLYVMLFLAFGYFLHAFTTGVERKFKQVASVILTICTVNMIEIFVSITILNNFRYFLDFLWRYAVLSIVQSFVLAILVDVMVDIYRRLVRPLPIVMVYGDYENDLEIKLSRLPHKYHIVKKVKYDDPDLDIGALIDQCSGVLINDIPAKDEDQIVKLCFKKDKRVYVVPKIADIILKASDTLNILDTPIYLCRNLGMSKRQRFLKRLTDIVISSIAVILFTPLMLITMLAIKLEDRGPVFYHQERVTRGGKHFMILKFRSMVENAEKDGKPHPAGKDDDRVTKVGKVIRTFRIDEMPQLFNVLAGDMSLVGPRPERCEHVEMYKSIIPEFVFREKMKGGLTGYAQVYGKYNTTALDKLKLDLMYITNYSIFLDFQIMFETVKILFQRESVEGFSEEQTAELHDYENESKE